MSGLVTKVHPVLALAREARSGPRSEALDVASPHRLYELAEGDRDLYRHAMLEAGHIVHSDSERAYDPCPICGHEFS